MNEELLRELNEERKELGIEREVFTRLVALSKIYQESHIGISEEDMAEVIREAMSGYDYPRPTKDELESPAAKYAFRNRKRLYDCFNEALRKIGYEQLEGRKK